MKELAGVFRALHILPGVYQELLTKQFGGAWLEWEPETLWVEIDREFGAQCSDTVKSKILALRVFKLTDKFFEDVHVFENTCLAVNDLPYDIDLLEPVAVEELEYALRVLLPIKKRSFGREVQGYVQACCRRDGLIKYPPMLAFAEPEPDTEYKDTVRAIQPRKYDNLNLEDVVQVQSNRLYNINLYVANKIGQMAVPK